MAKKPKKLSYAALARANVAYERELSRTRSQRDTAQELADNALAAAKNAMRELTVMRSNYQKKEWLGRLQSLEHKLPTTRGRVRKKLIAEIESIQEHIDRLSDLVAINARDGVDSRVFQNIEEWEQTLGFTRLGIPIEVIRSK